MKRPEALHSRAIWPALIAAAVLSGPTDAAAAGRDLLERSVVQIANFSQRANWDAPWEMRSVQPGSGTGFLIEGGLIMTNAHVVSDAKVIQVRRFQDARPWLARVETVGHDCDLAVLRVEDPAFYEGMKPLRFSDVLPPLRTKVRTYGYPTGGRELSSTEGVVSRIEYHEYVHTGNDSHLAVQTDAAINPGNSGGPVVLGGRVVGVAFQSIPGLNDVGFFIPYVVVRHFLDDIADGRYHGFADLGVRWARLQSPAYRRYLKLRDGRSGIVVDQVFPGSSSDGAIEPGDVLLSIDGARIDNDGKIALGEHRVDFVHPMEVRQVGDTVDVAVWRDGAEKEVRLKLSRFEPYDSSRRKYGMLPRYYIYAGLVFMPLDIEVLATWGRNWVGKAPKRLVWNQLYRGVERPETLHDEVVVLTRRLPDPVNSRMAWHRNMVVESVNGRPIHSLEDLVAAIEENAAERHVIKYQGFDRVEAINREEAEAATPRILETYGIHSDRRL